MTDAEDLLLEIANSMCKDFVDPVTHVNWMIETAQAYFKERQVVETLAEGTVQMDAVLEQALELAEARVLIKRQKAALIRAVNRPLPKDLSEQIARAICLSYGRAPDEPTDIMEMCDAHNRPVPTWQVFEEQADAILEKFDVCLR